MYVITVQHMFKAETTFDYVLADKVEWSRYLKY